jgi:hypothetical protein
MPLMTLSLIWMNRRKNNRSSAIWSPTVRLRQEIEIRLLLCCCQKRKCHAYSCDLTEIKWSTKGTEESGRKVCQFQGVEEEHRGKLRYLTALSPPQSSLSVLESLKCSGLVAILVSAEKLFHFVFEGQEKRGVLPLILPLTNSSDQAFVIPSLVRLAPIKTFPDMFSNFF